MTVMMAAEVKPWQLVINIITTVIFIIVFVLFEDGSIISAYRRGFFCDDDSINKPYLKTQVIPTRLLIIISILLIVVSVSLFYYKSLLFLFTTFNYDFSLRAF